MTLTALDSLTPEQRSKLQELAVLEQLVDSFTDSPEGPWFYLDGRRYPIVHYPRPPEKHPRRCHAPSMMNNGRRCGHWAEKDRNYCKYHGGVQPLMVKSKLPLVYAKHLRPTLAKRLGDFLDNPRRQEALELYDEIALARTYLTEAIERHEMLAAINDAESGKIPGELLVASQSLVREHLDLVSDLCKKMAGIQKDLSDGLTAGHLGMFVEQITRIMRRVLGDDDPRVMEIAEAMRTDVLLPREDPKMPLEVVVTYD